MRASDHQHYRDDAEREKNPRKKPRGDICTVGQFSWEKVNKKVKEKLGLTIYVNVKTNCLPYGKLLHHKKETEKGRNEAGE